MIIEKDKIKKAKEKLGDRNATIMAEELNIEDFDEHNLKSCCPFHKEDTPSFIFNPKNFTFHCFGCQKTVDIIDVFMLKGMTYIQSVQKLFDLSGIKHSFGELGVKTQHQYRYPHEEPINSKEKITKYLELRKISPSAIEYTDVREDAHGNIVFNYYDTNDVLTMVKYRPSHKIQRGEAKNWCQPNADTTPLLFNMNRINSNSPLLICEGEIDCLSAIEAGYSNAVSVPLGAGNFGWIEQNWDWLEQFESIIICADNDEAGMKLRKEASYRLGSWRTKIVDVPDIIEVDGRKQAINDLNEVLFFFGKEKVMDIIIHAKETPIDSVIDFCDVEDVDYNDLDGLKTGIKALDKLIIKLFFGTFNVLTGINGCVDCETEFFNGNGWKRISEYSPGDKVLQFNEDCTAELVDPVQYHKYPCDHFWHFKSFFGVDQMLSDEHNIVYRTSKGNIQKKNVLETIKMHNNSKNGFSGNFLTTFNYGQSGIDLSDDEIRVMCAVICDGAFNNTLSPNAKTYNRCRVNIKKTRKKERLRLLLKNANISYEEKNWNPQDPEYSNFIFTPPWRIKTFDKRWYQCSQHQLQVITDEILNWDGSVRCGMRNFSTTCKESADFIQFAFSACGQRATISINNRVGQTRGKYVRKSVEYTVIIAKSCIYPSMINVKKKIKIPKCNSTDGYKYCFTVPSGMLVFRRNGKINITGNSGKTSFLSQLICQSLERNINICLYSGEMANPLTKNWTNYILAGQRNVQQYDYEEATLWRVTSEAKKAIKEFYPGQFFMYKDDRSRSASKILNTVEETIRRYGCKLIILDNLTAISLEADKNSSKWDKQADLISDLIEMAKKYNVIIVLVAHPHKLNEMRRMNKMDIQGVMALSDLAHRVFSLYRVSDKDKKGIPKDRGTGWRQEPIKHDVILDVLKDRMLGREGEVLMFYDNPSRRFFTNAQDLDHQYSWDKKKYNTPLPFPPKQLNDKEDEVFGKI